MKGLRITDNLVIVIGLGCIALIGMASILGIVVTEGRAEQPEEPIEIIQPEEPQQFTPITYHVIECNVAGTDQIDYVIEISTRDPEEVGRIIRLLEGGE